MTTQLKTLGKYTRELEKTESLQVLIELDEEQTDHVLTEALIAEINKRVTSFLSVTNVPRLQHAETLAFPLDNGMFCAIDAERNNAFTVVYVNLLRADNFTFKEKAEIWKRGVMTTTVTRKCYGKCPQ